MGKLDIFLLFQWQTSVRAEHKLKSAQSLLFKEQDSLMRLKTMEYLATSTLTLTSLAQLLGKISNMVINDHIKEQVERALYSIMQVLGSKSEHKGLTIFTKICVFSFSLQQLLKREIWLVQSWQPRQPLDHLVCGYFYNIGFLHEGGGWSQPFQLSIFVLF